MNTCMYHDLCVYRKILLLLYLLGREGAVLVDGLVRISILRLDPALVVQVLEGCGTERTST